MQRTVRSNIVSACAAAEKKIKRERCLVEFIINTKKRGEGEGYKQHYYDTFFTFSSVGSIKVLRQWAGNCSVQHEFECSVYTHTHLCASSRCFAWIIQTASSSWSRANTAAAAAAATATTQCCCCLEFWIGRAAGPKCRWWRGAANIMPMIDDPMNQRIK